MDTAPECTQHYPLIPLSWMTQLVVPTIVKVCFVVIVHILKAIFHFYITSGLMLGYVIFCQASSFAVQWNILSINSVLSHLPLPLATLGRVSMALADVWNLYIFRFVLHSFCLSDKMTGIHVHMLSYFTHFIQHCWWSLPFFLIELHGRNCRCVQLLWNLLAPVFQVWSAGDSVIHTL